VYALVLSYIYGTVLLFWRHLALYTHNSEVPDNRKYRTIGIIGPPTPSISPFIRGSTVVGGELGTPSEVVVAYFEELSRQFPRLTEDITKFPVGVADVLSEI
jgi:hypothetical protein